MSYLDGLGVHASLVIDCSVDPLRARRAKYRINEPIVRAWRLLIEPNVARIEAGGATQAQRVWTPQSN